MFDKFRDLLRKIGLHDYTRVDEVTRIETEGRDAYKYMEKDHVLYIGMDRSPVSPQYLIYGSSIKKWQPPYENEEISDADKERILKKLRQWLDGMNASYEIV